MNDFRYNLCFFLVTYLFPSIGMAICFSQMGHSLHKGSKSILQLVMIPPAAMYKSRKDKRRVTRELISSPTCDDEALQIVRMCAVVITIFMVCWAPYHLYFILVYHIPSITRYQHIGWRLNSFTILFNLNVSRSCLSFLLLLNFQVRSTLNSLTVSVKDRCCLLI